jgi:hypothetical protein
VTVAVEVGIKIGRMRVHKRRREREFEVPQSVLVQLQVGPAEGRHGLPDRAAEQAQGAKYKGGVFFLPEIGGLEAVDGEHARKIERWAGRERRR